MSTWKVTRWIIAGCLMLWSGSPAFQAPIDDLYITTAFAHELVTTGRLQWTTGEVVEGVTSIPWTVLVAGGPLVGVDAALWARVGSVLVGLLILGSLSQRAKPGLGGTLLLWVTATWTSFSLWALSGFEMTLFAGLVALGWSSVLDRRWNHGVGCLVLAALVRPEGWALAFAASALSWRDTRSTNYVGGVALALVTWSLARFAVFGALLPTPFLVKFIANPRTFAGAAQVAGDLVVAVGPLCALWLARERRWQAIVPLLLGTALLVSSDGDWFAAGRMSLAGVLAVVFASAPRLTVGVRGGVLLAACGAASAFLRAPYGYTVVESTVPSLPGAFLARRSSVGDAFGNGFRTPLLQELPWAVRRIGNGDCLLTADVGILGNVEGICIRDSVGLVDRAFAEFNAGLGVDPRTLEAAGAIVGERIIWRGVRPSAPGMVLDAEWPSTVKDGWALDFWRRPDAPAPTAAVVADRWRALAERYPWQPDLWWGWGVFATEAGQTDIAEEIGRHSWRWPRHVLATATEAYLSFADAHFLRDEYVPGRGFAIVRAGERRSRPIHADDALSLVVDTDEGPVTLLVGWSGEGCPLGRSEVVTSGGAFVLPRAPCDSARLSVWFVDDDAAGADRNVYVHLRSRQDDDPLLPDATRTDLTLEGEPPAEWITNRGWAMWWSRALRTPNLPAGTPLRVEFDVDAPGVEGAQAGLMWEPPCADGTDTKVEGRQTLELVTPCRARLVIRFENDRSTPEDRNLYVGVRVANGEGQ
jgi:hypothetical protein